MQMKMESIPAEKRLVGVRPAPCWCVGRMKPVAGDGGWLRAAVPMERAEPGTRQGCASTVPAVPLSCSVSSSPYDYEISGPLGRDNYKEMYLFIYR